MTQILVSQEAVRNNLLSAKQKTNARILAVVKGNGYGMGLEGYTSLLQTNGVDFFAVGSPEEAQRLRAAGITGDILLLSPTWDSQTLAHLMALNILLAPASQEHLQRILSAAPSGFQPRVHILLDTGMHRYGLTPKELPAVAQNAGKMRIEGVFTHFGNPKSSEQTQRQHDRFSAMLAFLQALGVEPGLVHCCATQSFLRYPQYHHDMVRLGTFLVGAVPDTQPIWRLLAPVLMLRQVKRGESVGYCRRCLARERTIAVLGTGYGDGVLLRRDETASFPRRLRELLHPTPSLTASFRTQSLPVLGGAGVGHLLVDASGANLQIGDAVELHGNPLWLSPSIERKYC